MSKVERWIDLSELPKWGKHGEAREGTINWKNSIGCKCKFKYGNIEGEVEIVNFIRPNLIIRYLDYDLFEIRHGDFVNCKFGKMLKQNTDEFKVEIGQIFKDEKRDLTIIDKQYRKDKNNRNLKYYKYHCNKCGNEDWVVESSLLRHIGCNVCSNKKAKLGFNTIYDTDKWMIDLGISEEDAKRYTHSSGQKITVKCPNCKKEKEIRISHIYELKSIMCSCGDGVSYPEKFVISLLDQLGINHITQYFSKWSCRRKYDFYFEISNKKYIIETHGEQHYGSSEFLIKKETQQKIDKLKKELALKNGIDYYIELDCRKSNLEWVRNSIINSELNKIFNLKKVNWLKCEEFALSNRVKEVCDYWHLHNEINNEGLTTKDLGEVFGLNFNTICTYLKQGKKLNWCNYTPKEGLAKRDSKNSSLIKQRCSKSIEIYKNGVLVGKCESCNELERQSEKLFGVKLVQSAVSRVANGDKKQYKGFVFKYSDDVTNNVNINPILKPMFGVKILKDGILLGVFQNAVELSRKSEELFGVWLKNNNITRVCRGERKTYKGFTFEYISQEEYNEYIKNNTQAKEEYIENKEGDN